MAIEHSKLSDEFTQARTEKYIREQCELHGWAAAISLADPLDILIMLEEAEKDDELQNQTQIQGIRL